MADNITLTEMRTRARQIADCEVGASASRMTDAELDSHLNNGIAHLYDLLVAARGDQYYGRWGELTTTIGVRRYAFSDFTTYHWPTADASDFYRLILLQLGDGTNVVTLKNHEPTENAALNELHKRGTATLYDVTYALDAAGIWLEPGPTDAWGMAIEYIPRAPTLVSPTDSFDGINSWEEHAILTAAIRCKIKDEEDPGSLVAERAMVEGRISRLAGQRDLGNPGHIQDVSHDWFNHGRRRRRYDDWNP